MANYPTNPYLKALYLFCTHALVLGIGFTVNAGLNTEELNQARRDVIEAREVITQAKNEISRIVSTKDQIITDLETEIEKSAMLTQSNQPLNTESSDDTQNSTAVSNVPSCDDKEVKGLMYDLNLSLESDLPFEVGEFFVDRVKEIGSSANERLCEVPTTILGEMGRMRFRVSLHPNGRQFVVRIVY